MEILIYRANNKKKTLLLFFSTTAYFLSLDWLLQWLQLEVAISADKSRG